jgi:hypothetical protein
VELVRVPNSQFTSGTWLIHGIESCAARRFFTERPPTMIVCPSGIVTVLSTWLRWLGGGSPVRAAPVKLLSSIA